MWLSPKVILSLLTLGLLTALAAQPDDKVNPEAAMAIFAIGAVSLGLSLLFVGTLIYGFICLAKKMSGGAHNGDK